MNNIPKLLNLLYTPLDLPPVPDFDIEQINQFIEEYYDKDCSFYWRNKKTKDRLGEEYPWHITHLYYNMENNGPGWINDFDKKFPQLAEYFNTVLGMPIEEFGHLMLLPIRKGHTGIGFWHGDGDGLGIRMYFEFEHIGKNKLLMKKTKLPYDYEKPFSLPEDWDLLQDEEIECKTKSNRQWFYLNNIRAAHTTWTEVENSTRIALFICCKRDNWPKFMETIGRLALDSAEKYSDYAVFWDEDNK